MNKNGMLGSLIAGFIVILIAVSLLPSISEEIDEVVAVTNSSSALGSSAFTLWVVIGVLFFALGIILIAFRMIYVALRDYGLIGREEPEDEMEEDTEEDYDEEDNIDERILTPEKRIEMGASISKSIPEAKKADYKPTIVERDLDRTKFEVKSKYD